MVAGEPDFQKRMKALTDLWYIKGLLLKDPTIPLAVPISIENPAIAYDSGTDLFKVDIKAITAAIFDMNLAQVLGVALAHANPVISRLTDGSAFMDPRDRNWTISESLARSWNLGSSDVPDLSDRAARLLGKIYGDQGVLTQRATSLDLYVQLRHLAAEIDPRAIRALTATDIVTVVQATAASLNATVTQAAKDRTVTGTLTQSTKHDAQTFLSARIDTATATTNVEVVAAQGAGKKIYVMGYQLQGKGDVEAVLRSASTDLSTEWDCNAREGVFGAICVWPAFYFVTAANEALNIYLDAAVRVTGNVQYVVNT
jgi:hypothetical protein